MNQRFTETSAPVATLATSDSSTDVLSFTHASPSVVGVEPELLGVVPRKTILTGNTILCRTILLNLFAGFALVMFFFAGRDLRTWDALIERGETLTATVTDKHIERGKSKSYYRDFSFWVKDIPFDSYDEVGDPVTGSDRISRAEYDVVQTGDTFPVTYLPGSAGKLWQIGVADEQAKHDRFWEWVTGTVFGTLTIGGGVAAYEFHIRKHRRLLESGVAVVGRVIDNKITEHKGNKLYSITYEFYTDVARPGQHRGTASVDKSQYERYALYNEPFTVVYDPAEPMTSLPYFHITAARLLGA